MTFEDLLQTIESLVSDVAEWLLNIIEIEIGIEDIWGAVDTSPSIGV